MTTGTPEPQPDPLPAAPVADAPGRAGTRGWVPWVVTPLVVLLLGSSLDLVDQVAPDPLGGTSARFVPPEGHRSVSVASDGVETVTEHSRSIGVEGAFAAPTVVSATVLDMLGETAVRQAQWWRATRVSAAGERFTDLHRLSTEGILQSAGWGGELGFVFEPELLLLPADAQPGDSWRSSGSALADGALTYTAESTAFEAAGPYGDVAGVEIPLTGGCLGVDSTVRIASAEQDFATVLVESTIWCPGRGAVWSSGSVDDAPIGQAEVRPSALDSVAASPAAITGWADAAARAADLGAGRTLTLTTTDPFFGDSTVNGQFAAVPVATPDGRLVTANERGDDVQVWRLDGASAVLDWLGHPGGAIITVGSVGDLVVATTAQRRVVAYDTIGRRLWSWAADELVLAAPRPLVISPSEPPAVLVAARSGTITALDAVTGEPRWSTSIAADTRAPLAIADGLVLVADERERLTALDASTGAVLWQQEVGLVDEVVAAAGESAVVVMLDTAQVVGLELADGDERWRVSMPGLARGLAVSDAAVIALTDERALAVRLIDGLERWRAAGGSALVGEGEAVAIVRGDTVQLRSAADGAVLAERPVEISSVSASQAALAVGDAIVLFDTDGLLQRWELR